MNEGPYGRKLHPWEAAAPTEPSPAQENGKWIPLKPTPELLVSMALRFDHGFGLMDDRSKEVLLSDMRKVHEEVVGIGFYRDERKEYYASMLPPTTTPSSGSLPNTSEERKI